MEIGGGVGNAGDRAWNTVSLNFQLVLRGTQLPSVNVRPEAGR